MQIMFLYISAAMICTWLVQLHSLRYKQLKPLEKMRDSFICSLFTAVISLPLFDYFPNLPYSLALPIGAVVGTIGFSGWERLANTVLDITLSRYSNGQSNFNSHQIESGEPPMPVKRRRGGVNESK